MQIDPCANNYASKTSLSLVFYIGVAGRGRARPDAAECGRGLSGYFEIYDAPLLLILKSLEEQGSREPQLEE